MIYGITSDPATVQVLRLAGISVKQTSELDQALINIPKDASLIIISAEIACADTINEYREKNPKQMVATIP